MNTKQLVEINNKAKAPVSQSEIQRKILTVIRLLKKGGVAGLEKGVELSVAFVGKKEIAGLNLKYRNKDQPTDVLSFAYEEGGLIGEIVLCYDVIEENAKADGIRLEDELDRNIVHGILHILGFEHGEEMFSLQEDYSSKI